MPSLKLLLLTFLVIFALNYSVYAQVEEEQTLNVQKVEQLVSVDPLEKIANLKDFVVVMELFTSQACVFCPKADVFMKKFINEQNIVSFSCHIDYFDVKVGSLSISECSKRQEFYEAVLKEGPKFTPQMMLNGLQSVVGYRHAEVWKNLDLIADDPAKVIQILMLKPEGVFEVNFPEFQQGEYEIYSIEYKSEMKVKVSEGGNRGKDITYYNVVRKITDIGSWKGEQKIVPLTVEIPQDPSGFAIIAQDLVSGKIVAAGKYEFSAMKASEPYVE